MLFCVFCHDGQKKCKILQKKFADLFFRRIFAVPKDNRGVAQLVSASGLGPEGPVFESQYPDRFPKQLLEIQVVAFFFICILLCIPIRVKIITIFAY